MMCNRRLGRSIPMAWQPSCTVRVYLPRMGTVGKAQRSVVRHASRLQRHAIRTAPSKTTGRACSSCSTRRRTKKATRTAAKLTIRGDRLGRDVRSLDIKEPGWWTLGMSFTADGQVHYYGHEGVDDLTADDFLMSSFPYSMKCITFNNFFFNVANWDNGQHVVDAVGDRRSEVVRDPAAGPDGRSACTASRRSRSKAETAAAGDAEEAVGAAARFARRSASASRGNSQR